MRHLALPIFVVLAACSSSSTDTPNPGDNPGSGGDTGSGTAGESSGTAGNTVSSGAGGIAGTGGSTGGTGGSTGTAGSGSGTGGSTTPKDASAPIPIAEAGALSEAMAPHYDVGMVAAVAATPPAQWVNVTANLAGMASECGNTPYIASDPAHDMIITSVAQHGLWSSTDGGTSWVQLWPTAGGNQITNRGSSIVFDPVTPDTFWESGIYNGPGVYKTTDNGVTFKALGSAHHTDSVSVDLSDPARMTLLAGGHEQPQTIYRSVDGGANWTNVGMNLPAATNFCTNVLVIDKNIHLVGCSGYLQNVSDGVFRTTDGGTTWARVSTASAASLPLWASDGSIYFSLIYDHGIIKSTNQGNSWTQTVQYGTLKQGHLIELPDGRLVGWSATNLMISMDKAVTFKPIGPAMPFAPNNITYSPYRNAFYIETFDCGNKVIANAISRFGFDYRTQ